jgi:hypothetical protein
MDVGDGNVESKPPDDPSPGMPAAVGVAVRARILSGKRRRTRSSAPFAEPPVPPSITEQKNISRWVAGGHMSSASPRQANEDPERKQSP